jgi:inhibitor of cysteine peptidase
MKDEKSIDDIKESFNHIPIPAELDFTIEKAIQAGRKEKRKNYYYKIIGSAAIFVFALFGVNTFLKTYESPNNSIISKKFDNSVSNNLPRIENIDNLKLLLSQLNAVNTSRGNSAIEAKLESSVVADTSLGNATSFSPTNVQVIGVDEGDTLKTDGQYIYKIKNRTSNTDVTGVQIIKALPAENMSIVKTINTEDLIPTQMYVKDNYLVVIGNISKPVRMQQSATEKKEYSNAIVDMMYPYNSTTGVNIYDINDKTNTKLLRKIDLDGSYSSSRLIGSNLYFIASKYINKSILEDSTKAQEALPSFKDSIDENTTTALDLKDITYCPEALDPNFIIISSLNLDRLSEKLSVTSTLGSGRNIYSSLDNLYIAGYNYNSSTDYQTTIYKFNLQDGAVNFKASGKVKGSILNQFSMDEADGNLRVTTTNNNFSGNVNNQDNNLFVLNSDMKTIGKIEGLAKGERIYSTRFIGDKAFMVTFKNTDPLFVLDLKNPEIPKVLGELKIPGFSTYLHPYDANHIIGIGMDTDIKMNGNTEVSYTKGMKLAIFDVTDLSNPIQEFMTTLGDRGTYSEVLNNHKAILFSKEKNLLAFPVSINEQNTDNKNYFQGAVVYNIDLKSGFTLKGRISHNSASNTNTASPSPSAKPLNNNMQAQISRVIYINDNIYTISDKAVKANSIADLSEKGSLEIK